MHTVYLYVYIQLVKDPSTFTTPYMMAGSRNMINSIWPWVDFEMRPTAI
jgi:hypothetical protein